MELASELNKYSRIEVLEADSASKLRDLIREIRGMVFITQIYSDGKKHYAFIVTNRKIKRS